MHKRQQYIIFAIVIILGFSYSLQFIPSFDFPTFVKSPSVQQLVFCPGDCLNLSQTFFTQYPSANCAWYDGDEEIITQFFNDDCKKITVLLDKDQAPQFKDTSCVDYRRISSKGLMHNKFCVANTTVITGTANPTINDYTKNSNTMLIINNKKIANAYEKYHAHLSNRKLDFPARVSSGDVNVCFSPEGQCIDVMITQMKKAKFSVRVAAFSFTHPRLLAAFHDLLERNVSIEVVLDKQQCYNDCLGPKLSEMGVATRYYDIDASGKNVKLHDKIMVIDNTTSLIGSFNPTKNGNNNNDENLLVIRDQNVSVLVAQHIEGLWRLSSSLNIKT